MAFSVAIEAASKTYANGFEALKKVSFHVKEGEFFALLGPNGAGKTTLISAMAGLIDLTAGKILVRGIDVAKWPTEVRRQLGIVPQEIAFDPFFTVRQALAFQSGYYGIRNNDAWLDEILARLGLADKANTNTRMLSGGMKRRLMVAQALVHKPPVIVLDEPTAGVDVGLRQSLWAFIGDLNKEGHTVILTTHYLEEAQALCSRVALMNHGRLIALDDTAHLLQQAASGVLQVVMTLDGDVPASLLPYVLQQKNDELTLQLANYAALGEVISMLSDEQRTIHKLHILEHDLEEVFVRLTDADTEMTEVRR